ncbi:ABC transporter ATP-binding protein [Conexibacter stalactiti]|uniref:ABC transporter ATP-binding protein n=1 Tax=Conexibacter stalactiti TaxID=1940611 RepID=A0ABU4HR84_9ACTN|nr:ABC transporter ATP-binding protein [Conexibacter stalactiti]MDW5595055.1 ABC transporter ATP-binding protein [Conexibacter stalactiti]MEC5035697.1 ABC transporter ATP-binding protein [Conexibacter stalactiti]
MTTVGGEPILEVEDLRIEQPRREGARTIVSSVAFSVRAGETVGIVGESGSGKSLTARAIMGLLPRGVAASGAIRHDGRNLLELSEPQLRSLRGRRIGLIMQDPFTMLNPLQRCGQILAESLPSGRSMGRRERRLEVARRLAEVGIHDETVLDRYPFQLSGGMSQRVGIAAALARDPEILIADEPSTALDVATQQEILAVIKRLQDARGMALVLITHDLRVAFSICDRINVLYAGSLIEAGEAAALHSEPLHPYTQGLLLSEPPSDRRVQRLMTIPGAVPTADQVTGSCAFASRCQWAAEECRRSAPPLVEVAPGRLSACARLPEIRSEMADLRDVALVEAEAPVPSAGAALLVEVRDVRKVFRGAGVPALDGVSIELRAGESVGIVGQSGSGKTTLARILVGLERASAGSITIDGVPADDWPALRPADRRRLRGVVQMVFQDPYSSLNPMRTIGWTLRQAITAHDRAARNVDAQLADLLRSVGLSPDYARHRPQLLSGGERQRVAIARALAVRPRLLICDEPVSALDVSVQAQILNLFDELRAERQIAYLFITHDLAVVRQVTDRVYVMHRGRVVESGATSAVLRDPHAEYTRTLVAASSTTADR